MTKDFSKNLALVKDAGRGGGHCASQSLPALLREEKQGLGDALPSSSVGEASGTDKPGSKRFHKPQRKKFAQVADHTGSALLNQLFRDAPIGYALLDQDGTIIRQNVAASITLGLEPCVSNRPPNLLNIVHIEHANALRSAILLAGKGEHQKTAVALRDDDAERWVQMNLSQLKGSELGRATVLCSLSDITSQWNNLQAVSSAKRMLDAKVAEKTRELEQARLETAKERNFVAQVLSNAYDGIIVFDPMGHVKLANSGLQRILKTDLSETPEIGQWSKALFPTRWRAVMANWLSFVNGAFPQEFELKIASVDGEQRRCRVKFNHLPSGDFVANVVDVTELRAAQSELRATALMDVLTGLPNRRAFEEHGRHVLATANRHNLGGTVLFFDLDGFKLVNDAEGHAQGDAMLAEVGRLLRRHCREADYPARWGGDEFVVYLPGCQTREKATQVAERLLGAMRHELKPSPGGLRVGFSAGAGIAPLDGTTLAELLSVADKRMYEVKHSGKNGLCAE